MTPRMSSCTCQFAAGTSRWTFCALSCPGNYLLSCGGKAELCRRFEVLGVQWVRSLCHRLTFYQSSPLTAGLTIVLWRKLQHFYPAVNARLRLLLWLWIPGTSSVRFISSFKGQAKKRSVEMKILSQQFTSTQTLEKTTKRSCVQTETIKNKYRQTQKHQDIIFIKLIKFIDTSSAASRLSTPLLIVMKQISLRRSVRVYPHDHVVLCKN